MTMLSKMKNSVIKRFSHNEQFPLSWHLNNKHFHRSKCSQEYEPWQRGFQVTFVKLTFAQLKKTV